MVAFLAGAGPSTVVYYCTLMEVQVAPAIRSGLQDSPGLSGAAGLQVSAIIPAFNRRGTIARAISSALAQSLPPIEVIVIDDGSSDDTAGVVLGLAESEPRIRLLRRDLNGGGAAARNRGIDAAQGEILAFLDSDDEWTLNHLEKGVQALLEAPGSVLAFGSFFVQGHGRAFRQSCQPLCGDPLEYLFYGRGGMRTSTFVGTREGIRGVMFDESLRKHQDWDLVINTLQTAGVLCRSDATAILHVASDDRLSARPDPEASLGFFRKNRLRCSRTGWILFFVVMLETTFRAGRRDAAYCNYLELLHETDARAGVVVGRLAALLHLPGIGGRLFRAASRAWCRATAAGRNETMT